MTGESLGLIIFPDGWNHKLVGQEKMMHYESIDCWVTVQLWLK